jgi:hypothetical protein
MHLFNVVKVFQFLLSAEPEGNSILLILAEKRNSELRSMRRIPPNGGGRKEAVEAGRFLRYVPIFSLQKPSWTEDPRLQPA